MIEESIKKYLAIDYGQKRIGLASGAIFPAGLGVTDAGKGGQFVVTEIERITKEEEIAGIVIGLPNRSQGEAGTLNSEIVDFAKEIASVTHLPIYFVDEQFSSVEAKAELVTRKQKFSRKSGEIDELAAIMILESFLERVQLGQEIKPDIA